MTQEERLTGVDSVLKKGDRWDVDLPCHAEAIWDQAAFEGLGLVLSPRGRRFRAGLCSVPICPSRVLGQRDQSTAAWDKRAFTPEGLQCPNLATVFGPLLSKGKWEQTSAPKGPFPLACWCWEGAAVLW